MDTIYQIVGMQWYHKLSRRYYTLIAELYLRTDKLIELLFHPVFHLMLAGSKENLIWGNIQKLGFYGSNISYYNMRHADLAQTQYYYEKVLLLT